MAASRPNTAGDPEGQLLGRAMRHPCALIALAVGAAFIPELRQGAVALSLLLYLGTVGALLLLWSNRRGPRRGVRFIPDELHGRARTMAEGVVALEADIRTMARTGAREVRGALSPVLQDVSDLADRALRLAEIYQRAVEHYQRADIGAVEHERAALLARRDSCKDPVVRHQLEEAVASVDRRISDLVELQRAAARCEAAILNIETTLQGLQTRVLKFATTEQGVGSRERQELAEEIDIVRATSAALEDAMQTESLLEV